MANNFRGSRETTLVKYPVASGTVVNIGDLMYEASNAILPFLSLTDADGEEQNQAQASDAFVGVSTQASANGDTTELMIETSLTKEYTFTVVSGTHRIGDLLGASEATGTTVSSTVLEAVGAFDLALFRVSDDDSSARTTVKCRQVRSLFSPVKVSGREDTNTQTLTAALVLTHDAPRFHAIDPGGASRNLDLPSEAESGGLWFIIKNTGAAAEIITIRNDAGATVGTIAGSDTALSGEMATCFSDGTNWFTAFGVCLT